MTKKWKQNKLSSMGEPIFHTESQSVVGYISSITIEALGSSGLGAEEETEEDEEE